MALAMHALRLPLAGSLQAAAPSGRRCSFASTAMRSGHRLGAARRSGALKTLATYPEPETEKQRSTVDFPQVFNQKFEL